MSPFHLSAEVCAVVAASCWLLSVITREYSWVDRLWSIVPPVYVAIFAWSAGFADGRLLLMLALTTFWGARLTYNFWRKGGYAAHGEDYRWAELRRRMPPWLYQVFNFFFIAGLQNVLLWALALPAWVAFQHRDVPLGRGDLLVAGMQLLLLVGETIADQQQWRFQCDKKARRARGEAIQHQFYTDGLFRYSRHPNFFCEVGQWWMLYLFAVLASGQPFNVAIAGPIALTALFHGSTQFTEELSLAKYPAYADYQRRVSRLIPWWPKRD